MDAKQQTEHCTIAHLGLAITGNDAGPVVDDLNQYLRLFARPIIDGMRVRCRCGRILDGSFGSFEWGIANGEGYCEACTWPVRAYHRPQSGGVEIFKSVLPFLLLYHPDVVEGYHGHSNCG